MFCLLLAALSFSIWLYLLFARGNYWREAPQPWPQEAPGVKSPVAVVVPARNEAAVIERAIRSLCTQDYEGPYRIFLVDDHSEDDTASLARAAALTPEQLTVLSAPTLPQGWGGKLWAMQTGVDAVAREYPQATYILFTDADIEHGKGSLRELVTRAESGRLAMASFMVRLKCTSLAEKLLVPAFIYFFAMLYPFAFARDPKHPLAAAAGGAMLVRRMALESAGGLQLLKDALIDDCTLARHMKKKGPIWIGLSDDTVSLRDYPAFYDLWMMIARSAYAQLDYAPLLLLVCLLGIGLTFLAPLAALFCGGIASLLGFITLAMMAFSYLPILTFYRQPFYYALFLPLIALIYLGATFDSARRHYSGQGGEWKGRVRVSKKEQGQREKEEL